MDIRKLCRAFTYRSAEGNHVVRTHDRLSRCKA